MRADLGKVRQVLLNLLSNAIKFTQAGTVALLVHRSLGDGGDGNEVLTFTVRDSGIGIAPEQLECIFDPFTQVDASPTRRYGGTGLGLAISRHFCRMMGGDLTVESELGRGASFTVRLPVVVREPAVAAEELTLPPGC